MVSRWIKLFAVLIMCAFVLTGCFGGPQITTLTEVQRYEKPGDKAFEIILIVGKPIQEANRKPFEDHFASHLGEIRIDGSESYKEIPEFDKLSRETIKKAAERVSADAVLATRVVGVDDKKVVMPAKMVMDIDTAPSPTGSGLSLTPFMQPAYMKHYKNVRLETGLFDVKTEKMIWSASSVIVDPLSTGEAIKDFSKAITGQLKADGYIK